ncbi:hypothetical protein [Streptomyces sp. NPDC050759]|uniref:hypothetical protein n=1 Tax=Streptomyces sp. NPDC050759 TaxID=3365635 RepID=UPI003788F612
MSENENQPTPADLTKPGPAVEPTAPAEPVDATEVGTPADSAEPAASTEAAQPAASTEAAEPAASTEAAEPAASTEAAEPAASTEAAEPAASTEAAQPAALSGPAEPLALVEPTAPARNPARRRRRIAALVGSLVLAAGVIGGVGYTVVTVDGADRDAGAPLWKFPRATTETAKPVAANGLSGMLVPYKDGEWGKGPDIGEYGYDAELSGAHATALRKESLSGLPRTQRKALEKQIDKQRLKGIAMRSYLSNFYASKAATVTIELSELENSAAVREISGYQEELVGVLDDLLRKGPKIEGHKDARCFLAPKDKDEKLDSMVCFAHEGNVLVSLTADSAKPMQQKDIATLLREQLDRIAEPGESV